MNKQKLVIAAAIAPFVFFTLWMSSLAVNNALMSNQVKVAASGYDPRDLMAGHYIELRIDWERTDCSQFKDNLCPAKDFHSFYRFYVPEEDAYELDRTIRKIENNDKIDLLFAYHPHRQPLLKNLLIDNKTWQKWLQDNE